MLFSTLKTGQRARVVSLTGNASPYHEALLAMGLAPGTVFTVARIAPLGDPIEIIVRGAHFCLRKSEANIIDVEVGE